MERNAAIRAFVRELLATKGDMDPFTDAASLVQSGRIESVDAVEIAIFLEENFGTDFADMGFDLDMIDSVDAISSMADDSAKSI